MRIVYLFSAFLMLGIVFSQTFDLSGARPYLTFFTDVCLSYIMIEVGLEFLIDKKRWRGYVWDYLVAALSATFPWILCFLYFLYFTNGSWQENLIIALFAAPTSSGVLFSMLTAAGLGTTWLFHKIRILAIFDDVDTILLMIPLQFVLIGTRYRLLFVALFAVILVFLAWHFLHKIPLPAGRFWIFFYAFVFAFATRAVFMKFGVEIEVLLPAFVWGCMLHKPRDWREVEAFFHEFVYIIPEKRILFLFDQTVKVAYMFLVGLILPQISMGSFNPKLLAFHVLAITLLANLGKCFPMLCYRKEASVRERISLGVGMFPRGEVGAGILLLAIERGVSGYATTVAGLSLALNLLLTGIFISIVIHIIHGNNNKGPNAVHTV